VRKDAYIDSFNAEQYSKCFRVKTIDCDHPQRGVSGASRAATERKQVEKYGDIDGYTEADGETSGTS